MCMWLYTGFKNYTMEAKSHSKFIDIATVIHTAVCKISPNNLHLINYGTTQAEATFIRKNQACSSFWLSLVNQSIRYR